MRKAKRSKRAKQVSKPELRGVVLWRGPSEIDGRPVVVIATFESLNRKTGPMVQVWILVEEADPVQSVLRGLDASVCGDCVHRGNGIDGTDRTCYVNLGQAPLSVYRSWKRGIYPPAKGAAWARGRMVRWGAYGDPAAIPLRVVRKAFAVAAGHTGYTHQWKGVGRKWVGKLQASCDSAAEAIEAAQSGWATFLVQPRGAEAPGRHSIGGFPAIECLADAKGLQCVQCRICDGQRAHVWITAHGAAAAKVGAR